MKGVRMEYMIYWRDEFYLLKEWRVARSGYIEYVGGLCERCAAVDMVTEGTTVHHREYLIEGKKESYEKLFGFDNLELLCHECHEREHNRLKKYPQGVRKEYTFDEHGNMIRVSENKNLK